MSELHGLDQGGETSPGNPRGIDALFREAFAAEVRHAEDDLVQATWIRGIPHRPKVRDRGVRRRAHVALQVLAAALVVALAAAGGFGLASLRSGHQAGGPPSTAPNTPSYTPRYADGIPSQLDGQPVLRGQAAIDAAARSIDSTPFLIGLWAGESAPSNCVVLQEALELDGVCGTLNDIGDKPGLPSPELGAVLRDVSVYPPGPVVVRVHTHDAQAAECVPAHRSTCDHIIVADEVVWHGDEVTSPRPVSVAQVAAAFKVPSQPVSYSACPGANLPGVPVLEFPGTGESFEGIVAIFPTPEDVKAVAPEAAALGESDEALVGAGSACDHTGTDSRRGPGLYSFRVHWLARANLLIGIQYDTSVGPDADPFVRQARAALQTLALP